MKKYLLKRFKIFEEELGVFLWLAMIFLLSFFMIAIFRNYVETAFLKRYGPDSLPLMFVLNGLLTIFFFRALNIFHVKVKDHFILGGIFFVYALLILGLYFMIQGGTFLAYPLLFQLLYLADSFLIVYLWNIANALVNARQAKRIYPLLTSVMVAGATGGSFLTEPLARISGRDSLLILTSAIFLFLAVFLFFSSARFSFQNKKQDRKDFSVQPSEYPGLIKKYPMLRYLIIISLIPNILLPIFVYQFSVIANNTFTSEESLLAFFSLFRGSMTAAVLFILMFVSSLYSRLGLVRASLIYPLNFLMIFTGLLFFFNIYVAATGQFMIRLVQRAVAGPVNKIFFLIVPRTISAWSQVFVRGTVVKVGMMAGSLGMLLLKPVMDPRELSFLAIGLAVMLVFETLTFGRRYKASLKQAIIGEKIDYDLLAAAEQSPQTANFTENTQAAVLFSGSGPDDEPTTEINLPLETALGMLDDPEADIRAMAADSFKNTNYMRAAKSLVRLLDDQEMVRRAALESLATYSEAILPELEYSLSRQSWRGQKGILEVIRLAGLRNFDLTPYLGKLVTEAYHNLMAIKALEGYVRNQTRARLVKYLEEKNNLLLELVFQALWVKYADMRLVYKALKSRDAPVAVEMLECTIEARDAKYIVPLIDALPLDEKLKVGRDVLPLIRDMTGQRCISYLAGSDDPTTRMLTAYFLSEISGPTFLMTIENLLQDPDKDVRDMVAYALQYQEGEEAVMPKFMEHMLFLEKCLIFDGMGPRELHAIASIAVRQFHDRDETIIEEGLDESSLYLIMEGRVTVLKNKGTGRERPVKTLGPGGFFGELWLFSGGLAEESYVAAEPSTILVLKSCHFEEIMKLYPQIGVNLCTFFAIRLELLQARLASS